MFCPKCGSNNEDGARFCFSCGQRMTDGAAQTPRSGPAWRDFQTPQPTAPPQVPTPITPPPPVFTPPPIYQAPQVIIGAPRRPSSFGGVFILFSVLALFGAVGFAVYRLVDVDIDTSSWPLIGDESKD